jgi:hypothetical protein
MVRTEYSASWRAALPTSNLRLSAVLTRAVPAGHSRNGGTSSTRWRRQVDALVGTVGSLAATTRSTPETLRPRGPCRPSGPSRLRRFRSCSRRADRSANGRSQCQHATKSPPHRAARQVANAAKRLSPKLARACSGSGGRLLRHWRRPPRRAADSRRMVRAITVWNLVQYRIGCWCVGLQVTSSPQFLFPNDVQERSSRSSPCAVSPRWGRAMRTPQRRVSSKQAVHAR